MWIIQKETPNLGCVTVAMPLLILLAAVVFHFWQVHERHAREAATQVMSEKVLQEAGDSRSYEGVFERPRR